jgi:hypothetical protein
VPRHTGRFYPLVYPLLFSASPVLEIAARNAGQYRFSDLAVVLTVVILVSALAVAVGFVAVSAVDRADRAASLAAALTMLAVAWCFYYVPVQNTLSNVSHRFSRDRVLVSLGVLATLAAVAWLVRQPRDRLLGVSALMTRFGLLLVAMVAFRAVASEVRGPRVARRSGLVHELALPLHTVGAPPPNRNTPPRDIYLIVLDGHANARVLEEVFGVGNSRFEDSLRALGFLVPRDVRSNYVQTYLSVASLLNSTHVTRLTEDAGITSKDHSLPTYLVRHNRAARFLKARGYKYVLFPSAWWAPTAKSPLADEEFDARPGLNLVDEVRRTELRQAVLQSSLLRYAFGPNRESVPLVQHILRSFEGLHELAADPAPTFTFAHVLLPHVPYLLDERCRPLERPIPDDMEADTPEQRADYVGQVRCVDRLVLDLVTMLLRRSPTPPVILVVGDHGSRFADVGFYGHPESVSTAFIRERFGAFGAFYLPAGGTSAFGEPVTLVNVLGNVLRYYFNADLPPSVNEMYVSGDQPYRFYRVDPQLLGTVEPAAARSARRELDAGTCRAEGEEPPKAGSPAPGERR